MMKLREKIGQERAIGCILLWLLGIRIPVLRPVLCAARVRVKSGST